MDNEVGPLGLEDEMGDEEEGEGDAPDLKYQWNMADYLPPALRDHFNVLVAEFLYMPWRQAQVGRGLA